MATTHGMSKTRIYGIWHGIKARCYYPKNAGYSHYGGRGINVCDEWKNNFQAFYDWAMANGYNDNLSIDRIDVNGNYEPSNCRWLTIKEQQNNKTNNVIIEFNGEKLNLSQWAKKLNIPVHTLICRRNLGWDDERVLSEPYHKSRKEYGCTYYEYNGETHSLKEWAELYGMNYERFYSRWKRGRRGNDLFKGYHLLEQIRGNE